MPKNVVNIDVSMGIDEVRAAVEAMPVGSYLVLPPAILEATVIAAASTLKADSFLVFPSQAPLQTLVAAAGALQAGAYFYLGSGITLSIAVTVACAVQNGAKLFLSPNTNQERGAAVIGAMIAVNKGGLISYDLNRVSKENILAMVSRSKDYQDYYSQQSIIDAIQARAAAMPILEARAVAMPQARAATHSTTLGNGAAFFSGANSVASQNTGVQSSTQKDCQEVAEALLTLSSKYRSEDSASKRRRTDKGPDAQGPDNQGQGPSRV